MRVVHLYAGNLFGGIERVLLTLAAERDRAPDIEPHFCLAFEGRLARELRALGVRVHMLPAIRTSRPWTIYFARRALGKLLEDIPFDLAVTHAFWPHAMFAPVTIARRIPTVFWAHDSATGKHWLERWAKRTQPDLVLANSDFTRSTLPAVFPNIPTSTLYYPVSDDAASTIEGRNAVRAEMGTAPGRVVIICSCRMEPWKGHRLLIEALGKLAEDDRWECWIAGGAQRPHEEIYLKDLQSRVESCHIKVRVRFLGQRSDITRLLAGADIHCQPNLGPEPFGIAFIEAMYRGIPVVTTNLGAPAEFVGPDSGMLVAPGDATALADALKGLLSDEKQRKMLGSSGRIRALGLCEPGLAMARLNASLRRAISVRASAPLSETDTTHASHECGNP